MVFQSPVIKGSLGPGAVLLLALRLGPRCFLRLAGFRWWLKCLQSLRALLRIPLRDPDAFMGSLKGSFKGLIRV